MFKDLTVIIPAYNAGRYLAETLASLQPAEDLQVFLVDDGSTDNTRAIAQGFKNQGMGIEILSGNHEGPGAARNLALKQVTTKYCMFVDADDVVNIATLPDLSRISGDIVNLSQYCQNQVRHLSDENRRQLIGQMVSVTFSGGDDTIAYSTPGPMAKLYNVAMLKKYNIQFASDLKKGEDALFNIACILAAKTIGYHRAAFYHYRQNATSLTNGFNFNLGENTAHFVVELKRLLADTTLFSQGEVNAMLVQSFVGDTIDCLMEDHPTKERAVIATATKVTGPIDWRLITPKRRILYYLLKLRMHRMVASAQRRKDEQLLIDKPEFVTY